jgi:hypothetical protein
MSLDSLQHLIALFDRIHGVLRTVHDTAAAAATAAIVVVALLVDRRMVQSAAGRITPDAVMLMLVTGRVVPVSVMVLFTTSDRFVTATMTMALATSH